MQACGRTTSDDTFSSRRSRIAGRPDRFRAGIDRSDYLKRGVTGRQYSCVLRRGRTTPFVTVLRSASTRSEDVFLEARGSETLRSNYGSIQKDHDNGDITVVSRENHRLLQPTRGRGRQESGGCY